MKSQKLKMRIGRIKDSIKKYRANYRGRMQKLKKQMVDAARNYKEAMDQERVAVLKKRIGKLDKM